MSEWKKVKIGEFLTERQERFKPDDEVIQKYQRLDKIDFSGTIHLSNKPTKTNMILVYPGDLVISGINVAKGALTVYKGNQPVTATIHYSSYIFNESIVDLDFFKWFVKSPAFVDTIKDQVKGGIKTEIKASTILKLEITIPKTIEEQKRIVKELISKIEKVDSTSAEIDKQKSYAKQLRQSVLQDAIEGKLTADWRKSHPVEKGNPDYDAEALFHKIQEEKEKQATSKKKSSEKLAEISDEEKPFQIPTGWKWVRLGEIAEILGGFAYDSTRFIQESKNLVLRLGNIRDNMIRFESNPVFITNELAKITQAYQVMPKDILITMTGTRGKSDYLYTVLVTEEIFNNLFGYKLYVNQRLSSIRFSENSQYFDYPLKSVILKDEIFETATGSANQANIGKQALVNWKIPLPPLAEQTDIVRRVETQLDKITQLEQQITTREELTKQLMRGILRDAFEGEK